MYWRYYLIKKHGLPACKLMLQFRKEKMQRFS